MIEYHSFVCVKAMGLVPSGRVSVSGKFIFSERSLKASNAAIVKIPIIIDTVSNVTKRCKNLKFRGNWKSALGG